MNCCCPHSVSAGKFFSLFARRYRKRFARKGFEPSQIQLLTGLQQAGFTDATLLEVGSGVGHLHQHLLESGAASAVGIDLAPKMVAEAIDWARERGLSDRTRYIEGDFMDLEADIDPAEIVILDKVVCCYPDAEGLIQAALGKTQRVLALTYPRDRWYVRLGMALVVSGLYLFRSDFRPYVHDPEDIERWITTAGFHKTYEATTISWLTQIYQRQAP